MAWDHLQKASKAGVVKAVMGSEAEPEGASVPDDLQRLEIEPADNGGFTVTHHLKPKKHKPTKGEAPVTDYQEPKRHVFSTHSEMMAHLMKALRK